MMTPTVLAGFADRDITPASGYERFEPDGSRVVTHAVHIPLRVRVAIFSDDSGALVIASLDLGTLAPWWASRFSGAVASVLSVEPHQVLISCTHTHSSPLGGVVFGSSPDDFYLEIVEEALLTACRAARHNAQPATLSFGESQTTGIAFNRRPVLEGEEVATQTNVCEPDVVGAFVRFESEPDQTLQVLVARRGDGSVLGGFVSFACHPHIMGVEPVHSADFAGAVADGFSELVGGTFLFLQGASGDVGWQDLTRPVDWWPSRWGARPETTSVAPGIEEQAPWNPIARVNRLSGELIHFAQLALERAAPLTSTQIASSSVILDIPHRTAGPEQVRQAYAFLADPAADVDEFNLLATGHRYTFGNNDVLQQAFARETISVAALHTLGGPSARIASVEVRAHRIGDVGIAAFPAEMFNRFAVAVKDSSPFSHTVVCGLANGNFGYVPTRSAFSRGGYETRLAMTSKLDESAGDRMVDAAIRMLKDLRSD